jgi:acyl-coenzyme A synthetase/AMP-(fatty) acid ligase
VLTDSSDDTVRDLYAWMQKHLAAHKMPGHWWVVDAIPRTSRGKVNRDAVKAACMEKPAVDLLRIIGGRASK